MGLSMVTKGKSSARNLISLIVVVILVIVALIVLRTEKTVGQQASDFASKQNLPFSAIVPTQLPNGSTFLSGSNDSFYDAVHKKLVLRFVFPAQTLPGQGTLIVYETPQSNLAQADFLQTTSDKHQDNGDLGVVQRSAGVPAQPGQRTFVTTKSGNSVLLVSYALSDDELLRVADSM